MYRNGNGISKDFRLAIEWYLKAAQQKYYWAHYQIGQMYFRGEGVQKNTIKAHTLWTIAAKLGYEAADRKLKFLEKFHSEAIIMACNQLFFY